MSGYKRLPQVTGGEVAEDVGFDNQNTDLTSTNVQDAIEEVYSSISTGATKYIKTFNEGEWVTLNDAYVLHVSSVTHNKGSSPNCKVYELINGEYHEVMTAVIMDATGNLKIEVTQSPDNRFSGKLIVQ